MSAELSSPLIPLPSADGDAPDVVDPAPIATEPLPSHDAETIAKLAALKPLEYDRVRKEEAKSMRIQVKTLDDLVKVARHESGDSDRLPFAEIEPHPDPIDPAELLDEVAKIIRRHVVMDMAQADAMALWIVLTWFIDVVEVAPIAIITAPEKACGKSQLLQVLAYLVSRPLPAASCSASFLFRAIQAWRPTILIDEADTFIRDNAELKGLVNAGHTRANAFVGRTVAVGDGFEPKLFDVWGAKAFAGIALEKHLPDATISRGIVISLRRKLAHETVCRLRFAEKTSFEVIAAKLARFGDDYSKQVRTTRPSLPDALSDRAQDNWEPLLAIAACGGPAWIARATEAALKLTQTSEQSVSTGNELLADIQAIFGGKLEVKISTVQLIEALVKDEDKSWATYNRGKPLTPRQLAKQLAAYDIRPKTVRMPGGTPKGYDAMQFQDAFARYLAAPAEVAATAQRSPEPMIGKEKDVADETQQLGGVVAGTVADDPLQFHDESATAKPLSLLDCGGVADKTPDAEGAYDAGLKDVF